MSLLLTFIIYGVFGWAVEIIFTSVIDSWNKKSWKLEGKTYLWMLPLYGFGGLLFTEVHTFFLNEDFSLVVRLPIYLVGLYLIEYLAGIALFKLTGDHVWRYDGKWQYGHVINFLYAPAWLFYLFLLEVIHDFLDRITII